jgi:hypothetical protein
VLPGTITVFAIAPATPPANRGVTVVLQWCYSGVTVVLQWSYSGVTVVLQWCCRGVTVVLQWCYNGVTVVLPGAINVFAIAPATPHANNPSLTCYVQVVLLRVTRVCQ